MCAHLPSPFYPLSVGPTCTPTLLQRLPRHRGAHTANPLCCPQHPVSEGPWGPATPEAPSSKTTADASRPWSGLCSTPSIPHLPWRNLLKRGNPLPSERTHLPEWASSSHLLNHGILWGRPRQELALRVRSHIRDLATPASAPGEQGCWSSRRTNKGPFSHTRFSEQKSGDFRFERICDVTRAEWCTQTLEFYGRTSAR